MRKLLSLIIVTLMLSACGTTGTVSQQDLARPIQHGEARLVFKRNTSFMYSAGAASISVNGYEVASIATGASIATDVRAQHTKISVWTPMTVGKFSMEFDPKPGKTYYFMISPRDGQYWTGGFFGVIGDAVNASVSEQSGYFQIDMKP